MCKSRGDLFQRPDQHVTQEEDGKNGGDKREDTQGNGEILAVLCDRHDPLQFTLADFQSAKDLILAPVLNVEDRDGDNLNENEKQNVAGHLLGQRVKEGFFNKMI